MTAAKEHDGFEVEIESMLEKVFRIIHEGVILHEYLTDKEYATLAVTMKNIDPPLRSLRISQCLTSPLTTYALTQLLQGNVTLESLHLEANLLEADAIPAIAEILKQNKSLLQLHFVLLTNGLTLKDVEALSDMLSANHVLKDLSLYANGIDAEKTKILAATLSKDPDLEKLNLASNAIGDEGAHVLADALVENTKLRELNLSDCRIGTQGVKAIFTALKQNNSLQTLTLRRLSKEALQALSEMLTENRSLQKLDLSLYSSEFSVEQIRLLVQALTQNTLLKEMHIQDDDGKIKKEINEINELLARNALPLPPAAEPPPAAAEQKAAAEAPAAGSKH